MKYFKSMQFFPDGIVGLVVWITLCYLKFEMLFIEVIQSNPVATLVSVVMFGLIAFILAWCTNMARLTDKELRHRQDE